MTELDYLNDESQAAKDGMQHASRQIGRSIAATASQAWRKHPMLLSAVAAVIAGVGVVWLVRGRRQVATRTLVTQVEAPPSPSIFARAGGLIGKALFSLLLARLTTPPAESECDSTGDPTGETPAV